jgi:hypothetical protein
VDDITANFELTNDEQAKSTYRLQLDEIAARIGDVLKKITDFVAKLGFNLQDHYTAMRAMAGQV